MNKSELSVAYQNYIACLNHQSWPTLENFVHKDISYNSKQIGLSGFCQLLEKDFREIPDLYFNIQVMIVDPPFVASRLLFECTPTGTFFELPINGRKVSFHENVFYRFRDGKIETVWSVIDKAAIEAQLR